MWFHWGLLLLKVGAEACGMGVADGYKPPVEESVCPSLLVHVTILWLCALPASSLATLGLELISLHLGIWAAEVQLRLLLAFLAGG